MVGLSSDESLNTINWTDLLFLARLIPRILHNVNRVCYVFGGHVIHQITDITHTRISRYSITQLREADNYANTVMIFDFIYYRPKELN